VARQVVAAAVVVVEAGKPVADSKTVGRFKVLIESLSATRFSRNSLKTSIRYAVAFYVLAAILSSARAADAPRDSVFLVTDRPTNSVSPIVVPKGSFQFEAGYKYARLETDRLSADQHTFPDFLFRYGLGERYEVRFYTAGWNVQEVGGENETSFSDISVGTKIELLPELGRRTKSSLLVDVALPTGSASDSEDFVIPKVLFVGGYEFSGRYGLTYNIGPSLVTFKRAGEREHRWDLNYAVAFSALTRPNINLFAELYGKVREGSVPETHSVQVGAAIRVAPKLQLDCRVGAGLVRAAPDWFAGLGLAFRLP
jgi:hypothetical protein